MSMERDPWDMDDNELEQAFLAAKAEMQSSELDSAVPEEPDTADEFDNDQDNLEEGSDHDGTDEVVTDEVEADSEEEVGELDGDTAEAEEQTGKADEVGKAEVQPVQKYRYKANGRDYEFTAEEIMERFPQVFGQAMDYTRKMQQIKPWRQTIDAIEQAKLSHDDVNLMIDVLKGDKAAIAAVLKRTGVDTLELDTEEAGKYVPKNYGRDESALAIKDVVDEISRDQEYAITHSILSSQWDEGSWNKMAQNPRLIKLLHTDVKTGTFDVIQPIAEKMKLYVGDPSKTDLDYYEMAAKEHFAEVRRQEMLAAQAQEMQAKKAAQMQQAQKVATVKQQEEKRKATEAASAKRKAAAPTKVGSSKPSSVTDYLDDSEESYEAWYANLMNSQ